MNTRDTFLAPTRAELEAEVSQLRALYHFALTFLADRGLVVEYAHAVEQRFDGKEAAK